MQTATRQTLQSLTQSPTTTPNATSTGIYYIPNHTKIGAQTHLLNSSLDIILFDR